MLGLFFLSCAACDPYDMIEIGDDGMKKRILLALSGAILLVLIAGGVFWYYHPTHFTYNDRFILGSTKEQIKEKYGAFYHEGTQVCTYMIRDDTPELIMGYDNSLWYEIYFKDEIAVKVKLRKGIPGG